MENKWKFDDEALFQDDFLEPQPSLSEINRKLDLILQKLDALEVMPLKKDSPQGSPAVATSPVPVAPRGSMLEEIQTVLASQAAAEGGGSQGDVVSSACSLPLGIYDDNI